MLAMKSYDECGRCGRENGTGHAWCPTCRSAHRYEVKGRPQVAHLVRSLAGVAR